MFYILECENEKNQTVACIECVILLYIFIVRKTHCIIHLLTELTVHLHSLKVCCCTYYTYVRGLVLASA